MEPIEELYQKYRLDVYRYLYSLTHDWQLAEELLSDTFLMAFLNLPSFRGQSSIKTWLFGIARNTWLKSLRRQSRKEAVTAAFVSRLLGEPPNPSAEELVLKKELLDKIKTLLETREERSRSIIYMRAAGYDFSEIARKWKISENSARVTEFRVRNWLRSQLAKEGYL